MHWSFSTSNLWLVVLGIVWVMGAWLSWIHWRRRRGKAMVAMESLRLLVLTAVLFTLTQPERVRREEITESPEIVILHDSSGSMETQDLLIGETNVQSRAHWLTSCLATNFWTSLENRADVTLEQFGHAGSQTDQAENTVGTDLYEALSRVLETHERLKAVMLLSDGDWNLGQNPLVAGTSLRMNEVPVFAVGIGREERLPDLVLESASVPSFGLLGEQISIPFRVRSFMPREIQTTLTLGEFTRLNLEKTVTIPAFGQVQDAFVWQPRKVGTHQFRLSLPIEPDEYVRDNNQSEFRIEVRTETLKVLVIDSLPRWEYRYLRNALERDPGVDVDCLLYHPGGTLGQGSNYLSGFPSSREELAGYDVVFLGDVGLGETELKSEQVDNLRGLVEQQASGLVFLPGRRGRQASLVGSSLEDLLPVTLDPTHSKGHSMSVESPLLLTASGEDHFLTRLATDSRRNASLWKSLPGFYWSAGVLRARPGADVLAVHANLRSESGRTPILATRAFGQGEVLFMGMDGAWRWRRGVEDTYHYRFWGQVVRWMAHKRHMATGEGFRLSFTPENPQTGQQLYFLATVLDIAGWNDRATLRANIVGPSGRMEILKFTAVAGGWGAYESAFTPAEGGMYNMILTDDDGRRRLETKFDVADTNLERVGHPANLTVLRELARITEGAYAEPDRLEDLLKQMELLPEAEPVEIRFRLWSNPWWGGLVVLLLGIYWTARKASGMF